MVLSHSIDCLKTFYGMVRTKIAHYTFLRVLNNMCDMCYVVITCVYLCIDVYTFV